MIARGGDKSGRGASEKANFTPNFGKEEGLIERVKNPPLLVVTPTSPPKTTHRLTLEQFTELREEVTQQALFLEKALRGFASDREEEVHSAVE
jgi:hypothetical protein